MDTCFEGNFDEEEDFQIFDDEGFLTQRSQEILDLMEKNGFFI